MTLDGWTTKPKNSSLLTKKKKVSIEDKKADRCWRRWRSGQCPFAPWWSSSASLDGWVRGCQSRNIISRGRPQTNWVTKTISSSGNPSFNSPCAETLISEFTSNAFSEGQVQHLYLIYLSWCKYCWSFTVDLVRPHFSEVHPRIKLSNTAEIFRWSGAVPCQSQMPLFSLLVKKNKVTRAEHLMCSFLSSSHFFSDLSYVELNSSGGGETGCTDRETLLKYKITYSRCNSNASWNL